MAVGVGVLLHAAAFVLLRFGSDTVPTSVRKTAAVSVIPGNLATRDQVVRERLELLDPAPLIAPTPWNAGAQALPAELQRQPGEVFGLFESQMTFSTERLPPVFAPAAMAPSTPTQALEQAPPGAGGWSPFGRVDRPITPFVARDAGLEVFTFAGGPSVARESLVDLPDAVKERDWDPLEFTIVVAREGLVGLPSVALSSGVETIDAFFRDFLAQQFRIGERLAPGFYRVVIVR